MHIVYELIDIFVSSTLTYFSILLLQKEQALTHLRNFNIYLDFVRNRWRLGWFYYRLILKHFNVYQTILMQQMKHHASLGIFHTCLGTLTLKTKRRRMNVFIVQHCRGCETINSANFQHFVFFTLLNFLTNKINSHFMIWCDLQHRFHL